ncbi:hypothetical protein C7R54_02805 [Achromobacter aloeverae]|uniref:Uncharacterized protein n=1 Tax=Achromobacter aloeverae TaxID=1750518 RepID=A0A4V1MSN9_9BURK|nr:hypothetical protein C7R54_02805 [Achromobacter aloeverae]
MSAAGLALCAAGLMGLSAGAHADEQYKRDVAACNSGHTSQAKATCLREAGAAQVERRRNGLSDVGSSGEARNAEQRCNALPADQRQDCMYLMSGQGQTTVQGSVAGGGVLRETVIQVPAGTSGSTAPGYAPNSSGSGSGYAPGSGYPSGGSAPMAPPPAVPPSTTPYGSSPRY